MQSSSEKCDKYDQYNTMYDFNEGFNKNNPYEINQKSLGTDSSIFNQVARSARTIKKISKKISTKNK